MLSLEEVAVPHIPISVDDYVARLLAEAPALTPEQLDRLAVLLRPVPPTKPEATAA